MKNKETQPGKERHLPVSVAAGEQKELDAWYDSCDSNTDLYTAGMPGLEALLKIKFSELTQRIVTRDATTIPGSNHVSLTSVLD